MHEIKRALTNIHKTDDPHVIYALACIISLTFSLYLLPIEFIFGTNAHWTHPHGDLVTPNGADRMHSLIGMRYFLADEWHFPLFKTLLINPPEGTVVIFTDSLPLMSLLGKIFSPIFGEQVNYISLWIFLGFFLQGVSAVFLVRCLGVKELLPCLAAAVIALSYPAFLFRFGHQSLINQSLLMFALGLYFLSIRERLYPKVWPYFAGLSVISLLVLAYTFVMVFGLFLVTTLQYAWNERRYTKSAISIGAIVFSFCFLVMWVSGYFSPMERASIFGHNSMNLLSPWVPQMSGLLPSQDGIIDATGGQYEGFQYLGAGVIALLIIGIFKARDEIKPALASHRFLVLYLLGLTLFALSTRIFIGNWELIDLDWIPPLAGSFRSSGRFFSMVGYVFIGLSIVMVARKFRPPFSALILISMTIVQFIDAGPLRKVVYDSARTGGELSFEPDPWQELIGNHNRLTILPSFYCSNSNWALVTELVYQASYSATPVNTTYTARRPMGIDCQKEMSSLAELDLQAEELLVLFKDPAQPDQGRSLPNFDTLCRSFEIGYACSHRWKQWENVDRDGYFTKP